MHKDCYLLNENNRYFDEDDECYRCCHCNKSISSLDNADDYLMECKQTESNERTKERD